MADNATQMSPGDRVKLYEAVRTANDTNASPAQTKAAGQVQRELKKKYPDIYGAVRGEIYNMVMSGGKEMAKGGKATKKVPVVTIGIGMAEMKKGKKAEMKYGGMANGKKHMYSCGGSVHSKK